MSENIYDEANEFHARARGKIAIVSKVPIETEKDLSLAYTPGVAQPCIEISKDISKAYTYTAKGNIVAVITDGSAVLGLGNIGPVAAMPVMEGKAILFKQFAGIDAIPLCVDTQDVDDFVETVAHIAPSFGGINLEDIAAPRCFEIEERLCERLSIPVFHDDQHGTAIVALAALINALELAGKTFSKISVVINGAGAAGVAIARLLDTYGVGDIVLCDTKGIIYKERGENMSPYKRILADFTNKNGKKGSLQDALKGADVFIGVSKANAVNQEMVRSMAPDPIIFALANPIPEIMPRDALEAGAFVVCTGRSDLPNQVNNALVFPGLFRGALDVRAKQINNLMKLTAAESLARIIPKEELRPDYVIPKIFDLQVAQTIAKDVARTAKESGAC